MDGITLAFRLREKLRRVLVISGNAYSPNHLSEWQDNGEWFRVLSSYTLRNGAVIWIITEAGRSSTTILFLTNTERCGCRSSTAELGCARTATTSAWRLGRSGRGRSRMPT
jgi:hypothetical protein